MVLADKRFQKKRTQLPKWINQALLESDTALSTDMAVASAKKFLRTMAQPFRARDQEGISTWSIRDLEKHKEKMEEEKIRELRNGGAEGMQEVERDGDGGDEFGDADMDEAMLDMDA